MDALALVSVKIVQNAQLVAIIKIHISIKNLSKPFCWTYIKNQIATERFNSNVSDIEIIKNFFPTPLLVELSDVVEIDSSFIRKS